MQPNINDIEYRSKFRYISLTDLFPLWYKYDKTLLRYAIIFTDVTSVIAKSFQ